MVEVGNLEIFGTINTAGIDAGLNRMRGALQQVSDSTKPVLADLTRMTKSINNISFAFIGLSGIGVGLFAGLARTAPALASAFAKIQVLTGELGRSIGRALKPAFDIASESFGSFVSFFRDNEDFIKTFTTNTIEGLTIALGTLTSAWKSFSNLQIPILDVTIGEGLKFLLNTFGAELVAGIVTAKFLGGPAGLAAAGATAISRGIAEGGGSTVLLGGVGGTLGIPLGPGGIFAGASLGALLGRLLDSLSRDRDRKLSLENKTDSVFG